MASAHSGVRRKARAPWEQRVDVLHVGQEREKRLKSALIWGVFAEGGCCPSLCA